MHYSELKEKLLLDKNVESIQDFVFEDDCLDRALVFFTNGFRFSIIAGDDNLFEIAVLDRHSNFVDCFFKNDPEYGGNNILVCNLEKAVDYISVVGDKNV